MIRLQSKHGVFVQSRHEVFETVKRVGGWFGIHIIDEASTYDNRERVEVGQNAWDLHIIQYGDALRQLCDDRPKHQIGLPYFNGLIMHVRQEDGSLDLIIPPSREFPGSAFHKVPIPRAFTGNQIIAAIPDAVSSKPVFDACGVGTPKANLITRLDLWLDFSGSILFKLYDDPVKVLLAYIEDNRGRRIANTNIKIDKDVVVTTYQTASEAWLKNFRQEGIDNIPRDQ